MTPRGLRNNNPLNIEKTKGGNPWRGEIVPSKDSRFAQFTTMAYGYRAAFKLLNNYQRNYGPYRGGEIGRTSRQSNHHDKPGCDGAHCGGDVVCGERR